MTTQPDLFGVADAVEVPSPAVLPHGRKWISHALETLALRDRLTPRMALELLAGIFRTEAARLEKIWNEEEMSPVQGFQFQVAIRNYRGLARQATAGFELMDELPAPAVIAAEPKPASFQ